MTDYKKAWDKENTTQVKLKLNNNTDRDLIEWLNSLDNKQGTIKSILRNSEDFNEAMGGTKGSGAPQEKSESIFVYAVRDLKPALESPGSQAKGKTATKSAATNTDARENAKSTAHTIVQSRSSISMSTREYDLDSIEVAKNYVTFQDQHFSYALDAETRTAKVAKYIGAETRIEIPGHITYNGAEYRVTKVGEGCFRGSVMLCDIKLPDTIEEIEQEAFITCGNLQEIVLPEGLKVIGSKALQGTGIAKLELPASLESLGIGAVYGIKEVIAAPGNAKYFNENSTLFERTENGLTIIRYYGSSIDYKVKDGVTRILSGAFRNSWIKRIVLPESLKEIDQSAFVKSVDLVSYDFPYAMNGKTERLTMTIPEYSQETSVSTWLMFCLKSNPENPYFDFEKYDALIADLPLTNDKIDIVLNRLNQGIQLTPKAKHAYTAFLQNNADYLLTLAIKKNRLDKLDIYSRLGVFTEENIDHLIDCARYAPEFLSHLLNFKIANFGITETDYEL